VTIQPATTSLDADLHQVAALMRELQIRHVPVVDGGEVIGMVSARDLLELESLPGS
jgi:CBS domain-containing protein